VYGGNKLDETKLPHALEFLTRPMDIEQGSILESSISQAPHRQGIWLYIAKEVPDHHMNCNFLAVKLLLVFCESDRDGFLKLGEYTLWI